MPGDYDDLLVGLGDDDMNDFDGLDGDGAALTTVIDEEVGMVEEEPITDTARVEERWIGEQGADGLLHAKFALPYNNFEAPTTGFATARGKAIAPPSTAALAKIRKIFEEEAGEEVLSVLEETVEPESVGSRRLEGSNKRRRVAETSRPSLFTTGNGSSPPSPSRIAVERATQLLGAFDVIDEGESTSQSSSTIPWTSLFTTGGGAAIALPLRPALHRVADLFSEVDTDANSIESASFRYLGGGFRRASGQVVEQPGKSSIPRAVGLIGELDSRDTNTDAEADLSRSPRSPRSISMHGLPVDTLPLASTLVREPASSAPSGKPMPSGSAHSPASFSAPRPIQDTRLFGQERAPTPLRLPLRTTTNTCSQPGSQPGGQSEPLSTDVKLPKAIEIKTSVPVRRIGLGSTYTPGSTRSKVAKGFITPFMKGSERSRGTPGPTVTRNSMSGQTRSLPPAIQKSTYESVFDLTPPPVRQSLRQSRLHPQWNSIGELRELDIPDEIWKLDLSNAIYYHFITADGVSLGSVHALELLKRHHCDYAKAKWVDNHWSMILWKLAGEILAKPAMFETNWTWIEVIDQLKYRYEREWGVGRRPLVRRIHEHDSSPSLPMVICVSGVHRANTVHDDKGNVVPARPYVELTDGWYRILAEVDECLGRAIHKGKISVGRKLSISGARLDSGSDGVEVLDALDKSRLMISANSSALARWDTKLGFQPKPFVAGLSKLCSDGGVIVLMDVVIDRVFPLAYMPAEKGDREPPWNEAEESLRQDRWKERYLSESTRLQERMRTQLERTEELANLLASHAEDGAEVVGSTSPDTLDTDFDELLAARDVMSRLRSMSSKHIFFLAQYASSRMAQELQEGQQEVEAEVQTTCPVREIRDFRMVRFSDAQEGRKEAMRVGMLNVWDAKALGEGALQEGKRYLVTNLMPGRNGDWSIPKPDRGKAEIYLHTRRDTRWQPAG